MSDELWTYFEPGKVVLDGDFVNNPPGYLVGDKVTPLLQTDGGVSVEKYFIITAVNVVGGKTYLSLDGKGKYTLTQGQITFHRVSSWSTPTAGFPLATDVDPDLLPGMSKTKKGAVPATGVPSGKFLKDDGTWATPSGGGSSSAVVPANYVIRKDDSYIYCSDFEGNVIHTEALATGLYTILTAILAAGVHIAIMPGSYTLSQKISIAVSNVVIRGLSPGVVITAKNSLDDDMIYINGSGVVRVALSNFILDGNASNQASGGGIKITTAYDTEDAYHRLDSLKVKNTKGDSISISGDTRCCRFDHVVVMDSLSEGFDIAGSDHIFTDCVAGACKTGGFNISAGSVKCYGCKAFYCGYTSGSGWYIAGDRGVYFGCEAQDCYGDGVVLDGADNCLFFGLVADSNGTSVDWQSGIVVYNSNNNTFSSPAAFDRQATPTQHWGIHLNGTSTGNKTIYGSYSGNVTAAYYDESTGTNTHV